MKIGIITYHRSYNFGSALQAYALNAFLRDKGYETQTIDYRTERQGNIYKIFKPNKEPLAIARNVQAVLYYRDLKKRQRRFESFLGQYLPMTERTYFYKEELIALESAYDAFICGGDQIWNPNCIDFDESYLLSFVKDKASCLSYAPSIAVSNLPKVWENVFRHELAGYAAVSCREEKGAEILNKLIGEDISVVLDPVFLLEKNKWDDIALSPRSKPYIFCYFLGSNIAGMRSFANNLHKKTNLPLVVVNKNLWDIVYFTHKEYSAGPREFLGLIRGAEYICTNSFHAVAFALIYQKKFWAFINTKNPLSSRSRIENIAEKCMVQNRILCNSSVEEADDISNKINFQTVSTILNIEIKKSKDYLMNTLERINNEALSIK